MHRALHGKLKVPVRVFHVSPPPGVQPPLLRADKTWKREKKDGPNVRAKTHVGNWGFPPIELMSVLGQLGHDGPHRLIRVGASVAAMGGGGGGGGGGMGQEGARRRERRAGGAVG